MSELPLHIGIDIGGTFTDFVVCEPASGQLSTFKLLSTPHDPAQAVLDGLTRIIKQHDTGLATVIHGSTVATNALLERKGARTALITTKGFKDVLQIGRQNRPALYDLFADPYPPLVPSALRFEVNERVTSRGEILKTLDPQEVELVKEEIKTQNAQAVAVCLLFSFLKPEHEQIIAENLRSAGFLVSASSDVLPEYREYERMSTTVVNAYVAPVLDRYLTHLENDLPEGMRLRIMQSNGGNISPVEARKFAVHCILSGPAGGIVGCEYVGRRAFAKSKSTKTKNNTSAVSEKNSIKLITFDMGGTSTDVSLIDGSPQITTEAVVSGCPIRIPLLDIHTIGAGGGSIARVDAGGALRVGPESAGADPGPACYARGGQDATVTDANLVLGRIPPEHFLGGQMALDVNRARQALAELGKKLGLSEEQVAMGVVQVANAHMERALRVTSVERGRDPRDFTLLSFGGAGGLHAADLARGLGIPRVLVPPLASTLSAFGMLAAEVVKDYTQTVMLPGDTSLADIAALLEPMARRGLREVEAEGVPVDSIRVERFLDMRNRGQSYELIVPFGENFIETFHQQHLDTYGYAQIGTPVEIVNLRLRVVGQTEPPALPASDFAGPEPSRALIDTRPVVFPGGDLPTKFYRGEMLQAGNQLAGPAVVVEADTTILLGPSDSAEVDGLGNIIIEAGG